MSLAVFLLYALPAWLLIRRVRFLKGVGQHRHARRLLTWASAAVAALTPLCMGVQIFLLWKMGLASIGTALPLHLCSFMGVLTPVMLFSKSAGLVEFALYLGVPGAAAALVFPAVLPSPWPFWMQGAFFSMHALIALAPFLRMAGGVRPRPGAMGRVFLWGNLLLAAVAVFNAAFHTNYFFLRSAPTGTPLYDLQKLGQAAYVAVLEMAALVILKAETAVFGRVAGRMAGR